VTTAASASAGKISYRRIVREFCYLQLKRNFAFWKHHRLSSRCAFSEDNRRSAAEELVGESDRFDAGDGFYWCRLVSREDLLQESSPCWTRCSALFVDRRGAPSTGLRTGRTPSRA